MPGGMTPTSGSALIQQAVLIPARMTTRRTKPAARPSAGYCIDGQVLSTEIVPEYVYPTELEELLDSASDKFNLNDKRLQTIKQNKGAKSVQRINEHTQECYTYSEGSVSFPDDINMPARTLTTYEGTVNRSAHVIEDPITKQYRLLFLLTIWWKGSMQNLGLVF